MSRSTKPFAGRSRTGRPVRARFRRRRSGSPPRPQTDARAGNARRPGRRLVVGSDLLRPHSRDDRAGERLVSLPASRASGLKLPETGGVWSTVRSGPVRLERAAPGLDHAPSKRPSSRETSSSKPGCPRGTCSKFARATRRSRRPGSPAARSATAKASRRTCPASPSTGSRCSGFIAAPMTTAFAGCCWAT